MVFISRLACLMGAMLCIATGVFRTMIDLHGCRVIEGWFIPG